MVRYFICYCLAALCALVYAVMSCRRKNRMGLVTGAVFTAVAAVNLSYLARIMANTYFAAFPETFCKGLLNQIHKKFTL